MGFRGETLIKMIRYSPSQAQLWYLGEKVWLKMQKFLLEVEIIVISGRRGLRIEGIFSAGVEF